MMKTKIDYTLDSREVAEMIEKQHKNLIRDIKIYLADFSELNIEPAEFFRENVYKDEQGKDRPCYKISCACACAGGGRAGCSVKDFYTVKLPKKEELP